MNAKMKKSEEENFEAVRKLFPLTADESGITYLNSASTGPLCVPVKQALDKYYQAAQYLDRNADHDAFADLEKIRTLGAGMIGAHHEEVGFGFNTGFGLNLAAFGLPLERGDEILLSDIEFPSNVYPWLALRERGITVKFIPSSNRFFSIENFKKAIGVRSKVLSLSFVQFFNGYKNDLEEIGSICRDNNLYFVVDGIQGCGVEPLDVHRCEMDIFSSGAQKWLLSPLGTGIFYVRKELQNKLRIPFASWLAVDWKLDFSDLFHYDRPRFDSARRFELGTYPYAHVHAMAAALTLMDSIGVKNINDHNHQLIDVLVEYLESHNGFEINSSLVNRNRSSILSFSCKKVKDLYQELMRSKVICAFRENAVRISVHLFNNTADIRRLIGVVDKFA